MVIPQKIKCKIPHLGLYPKELKTGPQTDIFIPMFITTLFTVAQKWKQAKCPLINEWIHKMWYTHTHNGILFYLKRKEILTML